ncbi:MAG: aminomethyltransferase family protein, partial [Anaerolineales bacterium]|nr:aminomethyltransferase family protein [Anaerolineales bacterium]
GIKADITVMRLGVDQYRVVDGGMDGMRDMKWFRDHMPAYSAVTLTDLTNSIATLGVWGPKARDLVQSVTEDDMSNAGFPYGTCRWVTLGPVPVLASRISYVGELGWELHVSFEQGGRLWDTLYEAGKSFGLAPMGIGVYGTTGRLEKSYRLYGNELELEYTMVEAGLARGPVKVEDFIGKAAYLKHRAEPPAAILCTLTVDDNTSASGLKRYPQGREPILTLDGQPIEDQHGRRSFVTSAGSGPSVGKSILLAYLTPEYAKVGTKLKVEYFGEHYPVTVAAAGNVAIFDPKNTRVKA